MLVTLPHCSPIAAAEPLFERNARFVTLEGWPSSTIGVRTTGPFRVRIPKSVDGVAATPTELEPTTVNANTMRFIEKPPKLSHHRSSFYNKLTPPVAIACCQHSQISAHSGLGLRIAPGTIMPAL